jgi:hypothetical protein
MGSWATVSFPKRSVLYGVVFLLYLQRNCDILFNLTFQAQKVTPQWRTIVLMFLQQSQWQNYSHKTMDKINVSRILIRSLKDQIGGVFR